MSDTNDSIRVEIRIDRKSARRALVVGGTLVLLASAGAVLAVPITFNDGDTLKAADLNQDFGNLEGRVAALEAFQTRATQGAKYAVGAAYCGVTAPTAGDLAGLTAPGGSYAKAKAACETAPGCSPSAHLCTSDEIYRSLATGKSPPPGWVMDTQQADLGSSRLDGCIAFTTAVQHRGWYFGGGPDAGAAYGGMNFIADVSCAFTLPLVCCD